MFDRTAALIEKTMKDLARISYAITIAVQAIFIGLNGYKIATNLDRTVYLILYIVMGALSLFNLVFYIATHGHKKSKGVVYTKRIVKIAKYFVNAGVIALVLVQFATSGASELDIILSGISIISFLGQIVFEIVRIMYSHYLALFKIAISKDLEKFEFIMDPKGGVVKKAGGFFERVADKIHGVTKEKEEPSKQEAFVEDLAEDYRERKNQKKQKERSEQMSHAKHHFKRIFKKSETIDDQ